MRRNNRGRIFFAAAMLALAAMQGCGGVSVKNNNEKYTPYTDNTVIGSTSFPLSTHYSIMAGGQTGLGTLVADTMRWKTNADFAVVNAGTVRWNPPDPAGDSIPAGLITKGDVAKFLPYDNLSGAAPATNPATIVTLSLSGAVIKEMFENSFSRMLAVGTPGTSYGRFLQVSKQIQVFADVTQPVGSRITMIKIKDAASASYDPATFGTMDTTDTARLYRVAVLKKYIKNASGYQDFDKYWDILAQGTGVVDSNVYLYDAVLEAFSRFSPMNYGDSAASANPALNPDPSLNLVITHQ